MNQSRELTIRNLKVIEKKHEFYFIVNKLSILDCVKINELSNISVQVIHKDLPADIVFDIDTVFWK